MILTLTHLFVAGLTVTLPAETRVRGTEFSLGQVATIAGDDAALVERVRALSIGHAPAPGYSRTLLRWQLEERIEKAFPGDAITWSGAGVCRVFPEMERVRGIVIQTAAHEELARVFAQREATIRAESPIADIDIPLGTKPAELRVSIEKRQQRGGSWSLPVQILVDGAPYQTGWVPFQVELFDRATVLVRDVRRGELFGADMFETRRMRVAAQEGNAWLSPDKLIGATATRDLVAGNAVVEADVKRAMLVRQGDTVELAVRKGAIVARASASALQNGSIGDRVRVATGAGGRAITAVVTGRNRVEVDLSSETSNLEKTL
jgi:flagella basal body P-ring formation protein FlgA